MAILIDLSGKKALVTAASKGIGFGIAEALMKAGAEVIISSRNENNLKEAAKRLSEKYGDNIYWFKADNRNLDDLTNLVKFIKEKFGALDIFVFNTGGPKPGQFMELNMAEWENAVKILLYPAVYLTKELAELMINRRWGRIVFSTSVAIKEPVKGLVLSNTVRISLAGLIRTLAKELGPFGITVNGIMPGYILTDRVKEIAKKRAANENKDIEQVINEMIINIPAGRMGKPIEIGYVITFLASDLASYINGAIIPVDGGLLNSSL